MKSMSVDYKTSGRQLATQQHFYEWPFFVHTDYFRMARYSPAIRRLESVHLKRFLSALAIWYPLRIAPMHSPAWPTTAFLFQDKCFRNPKVQGSTLGLLLHFTDTDDTALSAQPPE